MFLYISISLNKSLKSPHWVLILIREICSISKKKWKNRANNFSMLKPHKKPIISLARWRNYLGDIKLIDLYVAILGLGFSIWKPSFLQYQLPFIVLLFARSRDEKLLCRQDFASIGSGNLPKVAAILPIEGAVLHGVCVRVSGWIAAGRRQMRRSRARLQRRRILWVIFFIFCLNCIFLSRFDMNKFIHCPSNLWICCNISFIVRIFR